MFDLRVIRHRLFEVGRQLILGRGLSPADAMSNPNFRKGRKTANPRQGTITVGERCLLRIAGVGRKTANPRQGTITLL